jgi:hypothetical protein
LAVVVVFAAAFPAIASPTLTSISPSSGYPGTQVTFTGTNFGATQGSGSVWLGNKLAGSIVSWSNTQIVAVVAATAASGSAQVQQSGVWGNSIAFTVITPAITSISPTTGYPGTQVTITGTNFGATQGSGSVWLGNKLAGSIVSWSNTQIVATVAATAASGSAQVQQNGVWGNAITFTVITPAITSISPTSGVTGTQVTFTGTNFGATQGSGSVWLGSKLAGSIVSWSNTQIVATVASGSVTGSAQVQQGGVWSNAITFTVVTPSLTSISPSTATAGDSVTLTGTNFGATQGSGSVWLGSKLAASIVSWSNTQIVATVASGSVTGTAQVQQGGVWTSSIALTVVTPAVTSLSPTSGPVGTQVTISGTGFGATQGSGLVWIGTKYASVVSWSNTAVVATVASDSATGGAQVYQHGVWSNTITFTVTAVTITDLEVDEFVGGGLEASGGVQLSDAAPAGGIVVTLSSSEPSVTVPATVTVPEGEDFASFTIDTEEVEALLAATITATRGATTLTAVISVLPPGVQQLWFDNDQLHNGDTATATVELYAPAPPGGAVVTITSADPDLVDVPATVTVAEGETEATFTITAGGPVAAITNVEVIAALNGFDDGDPVSVLPPSVVSVAFTPTTIEGGQEVTVDVTLSEPAAAGTTITFDTTNDHSLPAPAPLVIAEGETTGQTTVQTAAVAFTRTETLTAALDPTSASATLTIDPLALTVDSVSVSPDEVIGSNPVEFTVNLTEPAGPGGLEVDTYGYFVSVQPFVVVPEGETSITVPVETFVMEESRPTVVGAYHVVTHKTAELQLNAPSGNFVTALTLATARTAGGNLVTATVTLNEAAGSGGAVIALASDNLTVATVPATVTVDEGETTATFDIDTDAVVASADVTIRATYNGVIRKAQLTVVPTEATISLVSLSLPEAVIGDDDATGTVTISAAAPAGGTVVTLGGSRAGLASVPASVTVPEGETSATFTVTTQHPVHTRYALVTATLDGLVRSYLLQILYGIE